eukprot:5316238-Heterocapsa_arctica.AAC.1
MEEDALDRGEQHGIHMTLRDQTAVNNFIVPTNFMTPTTDMEMIIRVEELETEAEFSNATRTSRSYAAAAN